MKEKTIENNKGKIGLFAAKRKRYGDNYETHLFEQYKLYIEMADRISSRRMLANSFFLGIGTTLVAVFSAVSSKLQIPAIGVVPPLFAILLLCFVWWRTIRSYRQLNSGKYRVIGEIEKHLPMQPYAAEWIVLAKGKDRKVYKPLTRVEDWIPIIFGLLHIGITAVLIYNSYINTPKPVTSNIEPVLRIETCNSEVSK